MNPANETTPAEEIPTGEISAGEIPRAATVAGADVSQSFTAGSPSLMGLFPCLRHGESRWWLPLSEVSIACLGQVLLSPTANSGKLHQDVLGAIRTDPPLFLFAALQCSVPSADEGDLADWLIENASGRFAGGDAFLGAPVVSESHRQRFQKLRVHYKTLDKSDWMRDAPLWLEVLGPEVPLTWHRQWPTIQWEECGAEPGGAMDGTASSGGFLQQLARASQRYQVLQSAFDDRLHRNKLGALKQLAYGLSHEINNPLANISTRAQQLQRDESDPARNAILERIVEQVYRAHEMIADLMFYANPPAPHRAECDLNALIEEVTSGFSRLGETHSIRLDVELADRPAIVHVDREMMGEAIRGLIKNSAEAIGCGGTIVVSLLRETSVGEASHREGNSSTLPARENTNDSAMEGSTLDDSAGDRKGVWQIHVADSGPGLTMEDRRHAFDPYYSGREAGRGLGLGLCRAYRISKLHGGEIRLSGGPAGCVATISLPEHPAL